MIGAWDLPLLAQVLLPAVAPLPLIAVLYLDRALSPRLGPVFSTMVFPAAYVTMDYALGFTPLGTLFSTASTQFQFSTIIQLVSLTGIWGVSFLIAWFAAVVNTAWEHRFDLHAARRPVALFAAVAFLVVAYGSVRIATAPSDIKTVRVGGITVEHPRDYWSLLDIGTPRPEVDKYRQEVRGIEDTLFAASARARRRRGPDRVLGRR
jgi:apolipoprotein N-acyltransferase